MEVWAFDASGASYTFPALLTVTSAAVAGGVMFFALFVQGVVNFESGIPESFFVFVIEFYSFAFNVVLSLCVFGLFRFL
jgi:DNA-directed RNA polymerase, beta subunit/140 kD subunit